MTSLLHSRWAPGNSDPYDPYNQHDTHSSSNGTHHHRPRPRSKSKRKSNSPRTHSVPASPARPSYTQSHSPSQSTLLPPAEELARFMKIVSRLRWKLPFLAEAYRLATSHGNPEAEIMFKIDFFEYYALLERAIVHLLAVFNITVSSARGRAYNNAGLHRYHANVLAALEEETSPLTPVLGSGRAFEQLRQAKELRNRWKTADMTRDQVSRDPVGDRDVVRPLESYDLEGILSAIFAGLEEGFVRAREHVALCRRVGEDVEDGGREEGWEFMVDAMDWEAV
ncbi:hypothetical protein PMG11_06350 [Penicillium brasilianum]|uniref:Fungal specific transcription factor n=1 Tax=Penicillium brasilianum TaxID=104259 RepID=A0A0F7TLY7_PENBI|nr:hypothetical protein PMG11_06350 [Penicillium brasilianum]